MAFKITPLDFEVVVGLNSYVTLLEADAYLSGSIQWKDAWAAFDDATKHAALISAWRQLEREKWAGEKTEVSQVITIDEFLPGTGYVVDDVLVLNPAAFVKARFRVTQVGGGGEVEDGVMLHTGFYAADLPASSTPFAYFDGSTGPGSGASGIPVMAPAQIMEWPRTITDCGDLEVDPDTIPVDIKAAQCELAAIFAADPSAAGSVGAGSSAPADNLKKVEAGSAKVTYFKPGSSPIYPTIVWQLISGYRDGACGGDTGTGNAAFGTGDTSAFTCPDARYGLSRGYS